MLLIGLTGNIASGKSTVARLLSERGATIIDADVLARRVVEPGMPAFDEIVRRWGTEVVATGRRASIATRCARLVFSHHEQLEELNEIVHPGGRARIATGSWTKPASVATGSSFRTSRCSSSAASSISSIASCSSTLRGRFGSSA